MGSKPSNVMPIIDFVLSLGMEHCLSGAEDQLMEYLAVAKRIVLYLGQCSPQMTNDELVSECAQFINEDDYSHMPASTESYLPIFTFQVRSVARGIRMLSIYPLTFFFAPMWFVMHRTMICRITVIFFRNQVHVCGVI